jgi:PAS domain-containing protein
MSSIHCNDGAVVRPGEHSSPLPTQEIEVILARQLAGYLTLPIIIIAPSLTVLYYNEPAERMLGRRFDEGEAIPWSDWSKAFEFSDEAGVPVQAREMPLATALRDRRPAHRTFWMRGLDGVQRHMDETAIPLIGNAGRFLGAIGFFAEIEQ